MNNQTLESKTIVEIAKGRRDRDRNISVSDVLGFVGNAQEISTIVKGQIPVFVDNSKGQIDFVANAIAESDTHSLNLLVFSNFDLSGIGKSTLWRHVSELFL
jgi:hypothetical protein